MTIDILGVYYPLRLVPAGLAAKPRRGYFFAIGSNLSAQPGNRLGDYQDVLGFLCKLEFSDWLALISALGACLATVIALFSWWTSRRMYALAVAEHKSTEPAIELHLASSKAQRHPDERHQVYTIGLLVTNKSLAANSIKELSLSLLYHHDGQPPRNIVCSHDAQVAPALGLNEADIFRLPQRIGGGEAISGIALFPLANALLDETEMATYTVTATDSYDNEARQQVVVLRATDL